MIKKIFVLSVFVLLLFSANAQEVCVHKVKAGETLYRISKMYDTKVNKLKQLNDSLTSNLSLGQEIKVPCKVGGAKSTTVNKETTDEPDEFKGNYIFHKVTAKETVYSLTKKYEIGIDQFYKDNPEVKEVGLKLGDEVRIYKKDKTAEDEQLIDRHFLQGKSDSTMNALGVDTAMLRDSTILNIGIMLPFQFERNVEYLKKFKDQKSPKLYKHTSIFLDLYQGIKMGLDSLAKSGLNAQVFVYDTKADTNEINKILSRLEVKSMDVIIGPGYTNTFVHAAKKLKNTKTVLVSPFSKKDAVINGFPNTVRVIPSEKSHYKTIGSYVCENYLTENIIIATESQKDLKTASYIQREIIAGSLLKDSGAVTVTPVITEGIYKPIEQLKKGKKNIIILANNEEAFSSKLSSYLVNKCSEYDLMVFGLDDLKNFKNIEVDYWDSLNIHVTSSYEPKYGYPLADQFIKSYFKKYYNEPSDYAFTGYDFSLIFFGQLLYDRTYSHSKLVGHYFVGGLRDYEFKYNGDQNGLSNNSVFVYKFSNYQFIKLND